MCQLPMALENNLAKQIKGWQVHIGPGLGVTSSAIMENNLTNFFPKRMKCHCQLRIKGCEKYPYSLITIWRNFGYVATRIKWKFRRKIPLPDRPRLFSRNIQKSVQHSVENWEFLSCRKIFCQINSLVSSLVKPFVTVLYFHEIFAKNAKRIPAISHTFLANFPWNQHFYQRNH